MDPERRVQELLDRQAIADVIQPTASTSTRTSRSGSPRSSRPVPPWTTGRRRRRSSAATRSPRRSRPASSTRSPPRATTSPTSSSTFEDDDTARGITYLYAWHRYVDGSPDGELWGRYHHRFERTSDGWKIAELVLTAAGTVDFHRATMHPIGRR